MRLQTFSAMKIAGTMPQNKGNSSVTNPIPEKDDIPLSGRFCFVLQRVSRVISRRLNSVLQSTGITGSQLMILDAIGLDGDLRQKDLAEFLAKDHATITANLAPLVRRGLVVRDEDRHDRRAQRLSLTPAGTCLLGQARELVKGFEADLGSRMSGENALGELCNALDNLS